ncbi:DUF4157 domain-containing protein [Methanosarcina sp. UBA5]|uniref:eCIS core domain-containing protein n=1 Tax=Methanosarcina sp. UBA5 TaxID=1915593 RepID=UPI0025FD279B|nr:DUF4157 domain-containing protein [Methanosarcina sp. UBA5]
MSEHQQIQQSRKPDSTFQKQATFTVQNPVSHPASIIQRARINPKSLTPADILQLQRTIGNRAVGRLLSEIRNTSKVQQVPIQRQIVSEEEKEPLQGMFGKESEEETCPSCKQRQEIQEEEETLQGKFETIQRLEPEDEEKLQMKSIIQRQEIPEEEEPLQRKMIGAIQCQEIPEEEPLQKKSENNTGMPDNLKASVESLSGIDMSDVRVHYNSSKPAEVGALAYTQGTNIHVAPGQERHLPHEAWHVVQQKQERVKPTMQLKDVAVNDDKELEHDADLMGGLIASNHPIPSNIINNGTGIKYQSNYNNKLRQYKLAYSDDHGQVALISKVPILKNNMATIWSVAQAFNINPIQLHRKLELMCDRKKQYIFFPTLQQHFVNAAHIIIKNEEKRLDKYQEDKKNEEISRRKELWGEKLVKYSDEVSKAQGQHDRELNNHVLKDAERHMKIHPEAKNSRMISIALDGGNNRIAEGYSSEIGGLFKRENGVVTPTSDDENARELAITLKKIAKREEWEVWNCAEPAAAYNSIKKGHHDIENLNFIAGGYYYDGWKRKSPCNNCKQWAKRNDEWLR